MICRSINFFYRFGKDQILPKNVRLKQKSTKTKNYVINYARYTMLKNHFLWFTLGCVTVMRIQNKTLIFNQHSKSMAHINFLLHKENDCKFQLGFVKRCTLVVTEGFHILLSPLNRLVRCHFIMFRMYIIRTSWEHNQWKRKCSKH